MRDSNIGLLVGAGSVGKRHLKIMAERYEVVFVVDPSREARKWCEATFGSRCLAFDSIVSASSSLAGHSDEVTAVISNWGPEHHLTFMAVANLGITKVFIEKPLAHSLAAVEEMRSISLLRGMSVGVGHQRRYCGVLEHVRDQAMARCGGEAVQIVVHGGAKCLVTQGMHWIDFAHGLFGDEPIAVQSRMAQHGINPRSPNLGHWDGFIHLIFPRERFLTVAYSALSSVEESVEVYGARGVAYISDELNVVTKIRNRDEIEADSRITRVGSVMSAPVDTWRMRDKTTLQIQLDRIDRGLAPVFGIDLGARSTATMLSALIASQRGSLLRLPVESDDGDWSTEWPVS